MARNRQIGPAGRATPFARLTPPVEQVQADYDAMLDEDLGPAVFNQAQSSDDGRPVGIIRLLLRPAGLFGMALLALFATLTIKLWRDGEFESFRTNHVAAVKSGDKNWMLGNRLVPPSPEKMVEPVATERLYPSADDSVVNDSDGGEEVPE
jgi:hypothetical protein